MTALHGNGASEFAFFDAEQMRTPLLKLENVEGLKPLYVILTHTGAAEGPPPRGNHDARGRAALGERVEPFAFSDASIHRGPSAALRLLQDDKRKTTAPSSVEK